MNQNTIQSSESTTSSPFFYPQNQNPNPNFNPNHYSNPNLNASSNLASCYQELTSIWPQMVISETNTIPCTIPYDYSLNQYQNNLLHTNIPNNNNIHSHCEAVPIQNNISSEQQNIMQFSHLPNSMQMNHSYSQDTKEMKNFNNYNTSVSTVNSNCNTYYQPQPIVDFSSDVYPIPENLMPEPNSMTNIYTNFSSPTNNVSQGLLSFPNQTGYCDITSYSTSPNTVDYYPQFPQRRVSTGGYPTITRRYLPNIRLNRSNTISGHEFPGPMKQFQCSVPGCGKEFKRTEHLKRHMNTVHTNEKPYICIVPNCHKRFSRSDNLSQHLRTHRSKNHFSNGQF